MTVVNKPLPHDNRVLRVEDMFALAVRIIGAVILFYGLQSLLDALLFQLGYFIYPDSTTGYYLVTGVAYLAIGLGLLRGASHVVRFAYPEYQADERDGEGEDSEQT